MKRLYIFSVRSFIGPFIVTLCISMFILVMQFFWKYIDDLMGKGLSVWVIIELLVYVSASLIPLALPLAILLSSIMTLGNLAEHNELTALKSSGLSLYRILRPLMIVVLGIALFTFYFANYVIPIANLKWHSLIFDIQQTKISAILTPGAYSTELEGYAIKAEKVQDDKLEGLLIHDRTDPAQLKTVRAERGRMYKSENGKYLFFELEKGYAMEELAPQTPVFAPSGRIVPGKLNEHPSRRTAFEQATYKIDLTGFSLNRSDEDMFQDQYEMMNVFQLDETMDSVQRETRKILDNFSSSICNAHPYFQVQQLKDPKIISDTNVLKKERHTPQVIVFDSLTPETRVSVLTSVQSRLRKQLQNLEGQVEFLQTTEGNINKFNIEFHRKFALTFSIIVLFFVGAPLGAIVRKGGFGAPVVIAALLFMVYFVLTTIGDNLAQGKNPVLSPFWGMWLPAFLLSPVAFILMRAAANDRAVFDRDLWLRLFRRKKKQKLS